MKKLLTMLCALVLLALSCFPVLADAPSIAVEDGSLTVKYSNPNAQGGYTYVLLDETERIALVEINAGETWTPDWTEEGRFKVLAYYQDAEGNTRSEGSDFTEIRFPVKIEPLSLDDFLDDTSAALPSTYMNPVEYGVPTPVPVPTQAPVIRNAAQPGTPLYTLAPLQPVATAVPAPVATQPVSYPGTKSCFEHKDIRIRISDNDAHAASVGRSGPGTEMPQVATLNIGEIFQVLDCRIVEKGNVHWFMVNKNGVYCWVASGRCERY